MGVLPGFLIVIDILIKDVTGRDDIFIYRSGVMRGHVKTPPFRTGIKCLPHRYIPRLLPANDCMRPIAKYIY